MGANNKRRENRTSTVEWTRGKKEKRERARDAAERDETKEEKGRWTGKARMGANGFVGVFLGVVLAYIDQLGQ